MKASDMLGPWLLSSVVPAAQEKGRYRVRILERRHESQSWEAQK